MQNPALRGGSTREVEQLTSKLQHNVSQRIQLFHISRLRRLLRQIGTEWHSTVARYLLGIQPIALSLPFVIQLSTFVLAMASGPTNTLSHQHDATTTESGIWEGSPEGKAYSEFNHHLAGWSVILIGLSEMLGSPKSRFLGMARFLLPLSMFGAGGYLLLWSDHDAWPIGPRSFAETFFSPDWETTQHKIYAILLIVVGSIELVRRFRRIGLTAWAVPLPAFAIMGGAMLFLHSHGPHPSAHTIALHHTVMGTMAVAAGVCKLVGDNAHRGSRLHETATQNRNAWEFVWASLILLIGFQLLMYKE